MFKNFRVILRITPRDIKNFIKAAGRFIRNLLPALVFSSILLLNSSVEVFASTSSGLVEVKPSPVVSVDDSVSSSVDRSYYYKHVIDWIKERGESTILSSRDAELYYFFTVLVSDIYCVSTGSYKYPDGRVVSGAAYPVRAKSGDVYLNAFNPDYLYTYFEIFKLSMNDMSTEAINCCKSVYPNYIGCPNTNSAVAFTSESYPLSYSFNGFSSYFNSLYADYLVNNDDSGKSVGYEDLKPADFVETIKMPGNVFNTYFKDYNKNAIKVSFRDELSKNPNVNSQSFVKLYTDGVSCVGTNMNDGVYLLRYVYRDGKYYFSPYQYYFHREINVSSGVGSGAVAGSGLSSYEWFIDPISMVGSDSFEMSCCTGYAQSTINLGYSLYTSGLSVFCNDFITFSDENGSQLVGTPMDSSNDYYENHPDVWSDDFYESYTHLIDESGNRCGFEHSVSNYRYVHGSGEMCPLVMQYSYWHLGGNDDVSSTASSHALTDLSAHDSKCTSNCDFGYFVSSSPLSLIGLSNVSSGNFYNIDTSKIPDDYVITVKGDTVYDYSITNPVTGDTTTIDKFVINNYNFPENGNGNGTTSGDITVGGKIDVSGTVSVDVSVDVNVSVPDINININGNGGSGNGNNYEMPDTSFFDDYLDDALEESSGIRKFISDFFNSVPGEITKLICIGLVLAILCRLIGR